MRMLKMLDVDFLRLCFVASLVYQGDIFAACEISQRFVGTSHVNTVNLRRILSAGFDNCERTHSWLIGCRRIAVSDFVREISKTGLVPPDIRNRWIRPVLIRRAHL